MAPKAKRDRNADKDTRGASAGGKDKTGKQEHDGEYDTKNSAPKEASGRKKRKADDEDGESNPAKAPRRSGRGAPKAQPSEQQVLKYLLSPDALEHCRPEEEQDDLEAWGRDTRPYAAAAGGLSPFEELLCAVVLSRPVSHRLGLRTIRTILNAPYSYTTPRAAASASPEDRRQAMWDARTQHKDKTAEQVGLLGEAVTELSAGDGDDASLEKVREQAGHDWDGEREILRKRIKGLGRTGLDIFFRRVQWLWPEAFPFADKRTARAVEKLGLPRQPEDLVEVIEKHWGKLGRGMSPESDKAQAKRRVFVVVCDRAISADLEGKIDALLEAAARSS